MIFKIRMVSGREIEFRNDKYNSIESWIEDNFTSNGAWFQISENYPEVLKVDNIESISIDDTSLEKGVENG